MSIVKRRRTLNGSVDASVDNLVINRSLTPSVNNSLDNGTSALKWANIYATTSVAAGSFSSASITGTCTINTTGAAATTIGNSGSVTTISTPTVTGTSTVTGTTNVNTTGTATTTIGNSAGPSTTNIRGTCGINNDGSNTSNIAIGNIDSTSVAIVGPVAINTTGTKDTTIGNATGTVTLTKADLSAASNTFPATIATQDTATSNNLSTNFTGPFSAQNSKTITYKKVGGVVFLSLPAISAAATGSAIITQSEAFPSGYRPAATIKRPMIVNDSDGFGDGIFGFYVVTNAGACTITCQNDSAFTGSTGLGFPAQPLSFNTF